MSTYETRRWVPQRAAERFYRLRRRKIQSVQRDSPMTFAEITSREHLFTCFKALRTEGGAAAGPDGIRVTDISLGEFGDIAQQLSLQLESGTYAPSPGRKQPIPKSDKSWRELCIGNVCNRVVGKALHRAITPLVEPAFYHESWGFRPARNTWKMLAEIAAQAEVTSRWVLASADIRKAFDVASIQGVIDAHWTLLPETAFRESPHNDQTQILHLVETQLRGGEPDRIQGIDQGNPYSPTAMNIFLHCIHDVPARRDVVNPFCRYADDLVYLCRTVPEGRKALRDARNLLDEYNMELKGDAAVYDLRRGEKCPLLGFNLSRRSDDSILLGLNAEAWQDLSQRLEECHESPHSHQQAGSVLRGWVESMGPVFATVEDHLSQTLDTAASLGFREALSLRDLRELWQSSFTRWESLYMRARRRWESLQV